MAKSLSCNETFFRGYNRHSDNVPADALAEVSQLTHALQRDEEIAQSKAQEIDLKIYAQSVGVKGYRMLDLAHPEKSQSSKTDAAEAKNATYSG